MAITYTKEYETRQAYTEMTLSDGNYVIEYIATSPIDGVPDNVNAYVSKVVDGNNVRIGYATYANAVASVRFDGSGYVTTVSNQATISTQFFNDLQSILV